MPETTDKKDSKATKPTSFSLDRDALDRLKHATRRLDVTKTAFVTAAIEHLADRVESGELTDLASVAQPPAPRSAPAVAAMPGILDGLTDDQIWTVHNLVAILKARPQGSIFRNLETALHLAITDYRALRSTHEAAQKKTAGEGPKPAHRKPTGTGRHH